MGKLLGKWFKVYEGEAGLFLWTVLLRILLLSGIIIITNYADTAFLARYGVEKLPLMYFINPFVGIIAMAVLTGLMVKMPGARLLSYMFLFFGVITAIIRFLIPTGIDLLYPILWIIKAQAEAITGLLFLNLANDLFNIRQSKRLFSLIYAGGYAGYILFSFGMPFISRIIGFDNLLLVYVAISIFAALVVKRMGSIFPTLLVSEKKSGKPKKKKKGMKDQVKAAMPLIRSSLLIKILVILFILPTAVLTVMNFQFNFVVDDYFATPSDKLKFFGYFRGVMGIVNLILLLFVSRIYGRWGLPVALMFHPANYIVAFSALLFNFSWISGMYANMSTKVLSKTIFIPARSVVMGLLPESQRAIMMPVLRGVLPKAGGLLGSILLMVLSNLFHARYLSLFILPFVVVWLIAPIVMKRNYSKILLDLISKKILDLKSMEKNDMEELFRDKAIREQLINTFRSTQGRESLWYAGLMKSLAVEELDANILRMLRDQDDQTRIGLLGLLTSAPEAEAAAVFADLTDHQKPPLMAAIITAANRMELEYSLQINQEAYEKADTPDVRGLSMAGLYRHDPAKYRKRIDTWLDSTFMDERLTGVIAAGASGDARFVDTLKMHLAEKENQAIAEQIIESLHRLGAPDINSLVKPFLDHERETVRLSALAAFDIQDEVRLRRAVAMLGDLSEEIHDLAKEKIKTTEYQNGQLLIESLNIPRRKIREGVFDLLEELNIGDIDAYRFARTQLGESYAYLMAVEYIETFPASEARDLLTDHLEQKSRLELENVLRVLALQDKSGQMKIIWRGLFSSDSGQRANSMEALDDLLDRSLTKILLPVLGGASLSEKAAVGRKSFKLQGFGKGKENYLTWLIGKKKRLSLVLLLNLLAHEGPDEEDIEAVAELEASGEDTVRKSARQVLIKAGQYPMQKENDMTAEVVITDKILLLKKIEMFEGLTVSELAAVGSVTEEVRFQPGEVVIKRGEMGETMYLMISGEVSVHIGDESGNEIEVDRIKAGDYFGEMALFEDVPRSATIRTETESRLLFLHKQEFNEIVREYPQIALTICKVLSSRIRTLHKKIKQGT